MKKVCIGNENFENNEIQSGDLLVKELTGALNKRLGSNVMTPKMGKICVLWTIFSDRNFSVKKFSSYLS